MANSYTPAEVTITTKDGGYTSTVILDFLSCDRHSVTLQLLPAPWAQLAPLWDSGQANHKAANSTLLALEAHSRVLTEPGCTP